MLLRLRRQLLLLAL